VRANCLTYLPVVVLTPFFGPVGRVQPTMVEVRTTTNNKPIEIQRTDITRSFCVNNRKTVDFSPRASTSQDARKRKQSNEKGFQARAQRFSIRRAPFIPVSR